MAKIKGKKNNNPKHRISRVMWTGISIVIVAVLGIAAYWLFNTLGQTEPPATLKAAIIDQLYTSYPNQTFTNKITQYLENYGFQVDMYQGNDITINFSPVCRRAKLFITCMEMNHGNADLECRMDILHNLAPAQGHM